ncbi:MAG TPA: amidase family protein, partial [Gemmata sp.]|nr:amidase family protein [Gemmata sp.]
MASDVSRRELFAAAAALGIGSSSFHRAVAATAAAQPKADAITPEMVEHAEWIAGITLTNDERKAVATRLTVIHTQLTTLHKTAIGYDIGPAVHFCPNPGEPPHSGGRGTFAIANSKAEVKKPEADADLAFLPLHKLAELVRTKKVSSTELTKLYLGRLRKYDPALLCAISITEELALKQATAADAEIAAGKYRGPLHGVPWVAKDLIAYPGYPTTWGAGHFKQQKF